MIFEVPSFRRARREAFRVIRAELGARRVYVYPISDTLAAGFESPPEPHQLRFAKLLKELFKSEGAFFAVQKYDNKAVVIFRDDRGNVRRFELPAEPDAIVACIGETNADEVFYIPDDEQTQLIEQVKNIAHVAFDRPIQFHAVDIEVDDDDLSHIEFNRSVIEEVQAWLMAHRGTIARVGVAMSLVILLATGGVYVYKLFQKRRYRGAVTLRKAMQNTDVVTWFDKNMWVADIAKNLIDAGAVYVRWDGNRLMAVFADGGSVLSKLSKSVDLSGASLVENAGGYIMVSATVPSRLHPPVQCRFSDDLFVGDTVWGHPVPYDAFATADDVGRALQRLMCVSSPVTFSVVHLNDVWYLHVTSNTAAPTPASSTAVAETGVESKAGSSPTGKVSTQLNINAGGSLQ